MKSYFLRLSSCSYTFQKCEVINQAFYAVKKLIVGKLRFKLLPLYTLAEYLMMKTQVNLSCCVHCYMNNMKHYSTELVGINALAAAAAAAQYLVNFFSFYVLKHLIVLSLSSIIVLREQSKSPDLYK